ncbi:MAG: hypothetical protein ACK5Q5_12340 [Planctomycetaceae bacterium]
MTSSRSTRTVTLVIGTLAAFVLHGILSSYRDAGYGGPHHDEVIGLLAAKGLERRYAETLAARQQPFGQVVEAEVWHTWTRGFTPVPFGEIASDVMSCDKHPPLAFWVLNRWLSLFEEGQYQQAVVLTWLQMLTAGGLLGWLAARFTGSVGWGLAAMTLFLFGNAAVFTGVWVRQYSLFAILYAAAMILATELVRQSTNLARFVVLSAVLAVVCMLGMMTQYTFATMSGPMHAALMGVLVWRRDWRRAALLASAYAAAGVAFFLILPNALDQARAVSSDMSGQWQWGDAFGGLPQSVIPWPSSVPAAFTIACGVLILAGVGCMAVWLTFRRSSEGDCDPAPMAVIGSGLLGAGALQVILVGAGYYPGWATGPNHMCAFWLLTVFCLTSWLALQPRRFAAVSTALLLGGMVGMQVLYAWHCHRILPRVNTSYVASQQPGLVIGDNLARGFVLQIAEVLPPEQPVLFADTSLVQEQFTRGNLTDYRRVLYLPMDDTARDGQALVVDAARQSGWKATQLPVVHTGMYDAVLIEALEGTPAAAEDETPGGAP